MNRSKILLLFGGESTEHDISILSASNVYEAIDYEFFDVYLGYIDTNGLWWSIEKFEDYTLPGAVPLTPLLGQKSFLAGDQKMYIDAILPILHGKNGEDGSVQGLSQLLHIPIVGCDMTSSALGMDKVTAKRVAQQIGINVVPYRVYRAGETPPSYDALRDELGDTLFIKPSRAGSSVGVSKVHTHGEFEAALAAAVAVDATILIETALDVRELETAALGVPPRHEISRVGEIVPGEEFYSYEDKYAASSTSSVSIPADIAGDIQTQVSTQAKLLFAELGASGLSRIDFFLTADGTIYFNEINTLPGFTDISMYPKLWQDSGLSYRELITRLIRQTLD